MMDHITSIDKNYIFISSKKPNECIYSMNDIQIIFSKHITTSELRMLQIQENLKTCLTLTRISPVSNLSIKFSASISMSIYSIFNHSAKSSFMA